MRIYWESGHGKSKGDGAGGTLKVQLDKPVYVENCFHHSPKEVFEYCKEKLSYTRDSGRTRHRVFHFLAPDQVVKKEDEKDIERVVGTLKIRQVFQIKDHQIGIREAACVCNDCRMFRFGECKKPFVGHQLKSTQQCNVGDEAENEELLNTLPVITVSDFVAIRWENEWFPDQVIGVNGAEDDNPTFSITCLHGTGSGDLGQFIWSSPADIVNDVPRKEILCKLPHPIARSNRHIGWINTDIHHIDQLL